ncbi:hypothetical protein LCGC14_1645470 [marine sediment metagenome]|uniref:Uncharacterized protein n=1 Tax=marine sediment metagenome TaxID=412755 RepID=A0A0F9HZ50_9ZZZZ
MNQVDQKLRDDFPNPDSPISDIQTPTNHNQKGLTSRPPPLERLSRIGSIKDGSR